MIPALLVLLTAATPCYGFYFEMRPGQKICFSENVETDGEMLIIDYAQRLMAAGVDTELHVYPGVPHGVRFWQDTEPARRYRDDQVDWLRRQFAALAEH